MQELNFPGMFILAAMFVPVVACVLALFNERIIRTRYIATFLIHYLTISLGILAVVVLALARVIDGSVCAALLGGIFGYVLGKQVSRTAATQEEMLPTLSRDVPTNKQDS